MTAYCSGEKPNATGRKVLYKVKVHETQKEESVRCMVYTGYCVVMSAIMLSNAMFDDSSAHLQLAQACPEDQGLPDGGNWLP